MTPVYQTLVSKTNGNCMQAAFASLFDLPLDEVPNFIEHGCMWAQVMFEFISPRGYEFNGTLYNSRYFELIQPEYGLPKDRFPELKTMNGVNGYFFASVYSPKFYDPADKRPTQHAVIINNDLQIVHDVNPEYKGVRSYPLADKVGYNGILEVLMIEKKEL